MMSMNGFHMSLQTNFNFLCFVLSELVEKLMDRFPRCVEARFRQRIESGGATPLDRGEFGTQVLLLKPESWLYFCGVIVGMEQAEVSPRPAVKAIILVSALAVSLLLWLLYGHHASADFAGRWTFLPALNAILNGLCTIALCVGLYFIGQRNKGAHRTSMLLAFAFSSIFLVSYIVNHTLHGDTIFPGQGTVRTLYLSILASHVILSIVALPMILTTFFLSVTGRFAMHRRIARLTFPIWLYVSFTGVVVFVFLKAYASY